MRKIQIEIKATNGNDRIQCEDKLIAESSATIKYDMCLGIHSISI